MLEPWLIGDPNLAGTGVLGLGVPLGANGVEYGHGTLYVANTEQFTAVAVPIRPKGDPGSSRILANLPVGGPFPAAPDGLTLDARGNIYVAAISLSSVLRIARDGSVEFVAAGDPLDWPSSLAFGTTGGEQKTIFAVNFSIGENFGDPVMRSGPGLVSIFVGIPGQPAVVSPNLRGIACELLSSGSSRLQVRV